jgi:hypothetical protein
VDSAKLFIDLTPTIVPTAVRGRIYYDNASNSLRYYNGSEWRTIDPWEQPLMTSASTPAPYAVSASTAQDTIWGVFDGIIINTGSWWLTGYGLYTGIGQTYTGSAGKSGIANLGEWIVLTLDEARSISKVFLYPRMSTASGQPRSYHIIYSNDNITYTSIINRVDQTLSVPTYITFTPTTAKYWGIQVYRVAGDTYSVLLEMTFLTK